MFDQKPSAKIGDPARGRRATARMSGAGRPFATTKTPRARGGCVEVLGNCSRINGAPNGRAEQLGLFFYTMQPIGVLAMLICVWFLSGMTCGSEEYRVGARSLRSLAKAALTRSASDGDLPSGVWPGYHGVSPSRADSSHRPRADHVAWIPKPNSPTAFLPTKESTMPESRSQAQKTAKPSRRTFLKRSTATLAGTAAVASLALPRSVHAANDDTIKVALIGCGGRGSGAATNACKADENVKLTVMADAFEDRLQSSRNALKSRLGEKFAVDDDHCFVGFDAYKQAIASDVDLVILTTPPHFRPAQLEAAIAAGKHVFCEKPVAVDGPGVRSVLETVAEAKKKDLSIVSGLCWRYDKGVQETIARIKDGAIGDIVAIQENYLTGTLWHRGRKPEWSEMEFQMRNWLYFTWLSGDHNVEQHIHSLDKAVWLMDDEGPAVAYGMGGRQVRTGQEYGNIYDHHAVCYEFANGVKCFAYTRQMRGCFGNTEDYILGTKGKAQILRNSIQGTEEWRFRGEKPSMYDLEHEALFAGIRSGKHINNGVYMARSTMMAIMGRMACYTGQKITWDQALNSTEDLTPAKYEWGDVPSPAVAMPGVTPFV